MSEFAGYEKMPDSLKKLRLNDNDFQKLEKTLWVVTEKIHGANFSFTYQDGQLKFAKRKSYLDWNDDFFGFQEVVVSLEDKIMKLFEILSLEIDAKQYLIYGELFGGEYPHESVPAVPQVQAIQTGVYYCPEIQFCAFDIAIVQDGGIKSYLDYELSMRYFEKFQLLYAKSLFSGKLTEALNFDTRINSTLPEQLGYPGLKNNLIEGIVIKPLKELSPSQIKTRPIFKIKNVEFEEEKKFHEAQKWSYIPEVSSQNQELDFILRDIKGYLNDNRLQSAISKIGHLDFGNADRIQAIQQELLEDILQDFDLNHDHLLAELSPKQNDWIRERIQAEINKFLKSKQIP